MAVSLYLQQREGGSGHAKYLPHVTEKQEKDCGLELRQLTSSAMVTVKTGQNPICLLLWLHGKGLWMPTSGGEGWAYPSSFVPVALSSVYLFLRLQGN